jgi:DNA/RNA endonuclease G (NUC1)
VPFNGSGGAELLIERPQFVSSWSDQRGGPSWVSWNINATHFGSVDRCNCFTTESLLPSFFYQVHDFDYRNSGYDRGHMVMSVSRTTTLQENAATFLLSNILPQASSNNSGPWLGFEIQNNDLARLDGKELYVIAGGQYAPVPPTLKDEGNVHVPDYTWKVTVVLDGGCGVECVQTPADLEITAVRMPNLVNASGPASADNIRNDPWQMYETTVASIEAATGYTLLSALPEWIQPIVKNADSKPVANAGGPYTSVAGAMLAFDGTASFDPDPDDVLSYRWFFGDGGTATGEAPTYSYDLPGAYAAMLIVTDRWGWADTAFAAVAVDEPTPTPGSITGAAGFASPAGSLPAVPDLAPDVQLAVTARRLPNGGLQGNLELHVDDSRLRFTATELSWLTVENGVAQLVGDGRLKDDDGGLYRFRLRVEQPDGRSHVRIRVLDDAGAVVFDNLPGAPLDTTSPSERGSIRIRD